jgi:hypothetical protein
MNRTAHITAVFGLLACAICGPARSAVMTSGVRVSGSTAPYAVSYDLGQDATRLTITIRDAATGDVARTFSSIGTNPEIVSADMKMGRHPNVVMWDGRTDAGGAAPGGSYYAQVLTNGNGGSALRLLSFTPLPFAAAPGKTEARGIYGGEVNRSANSPYRNLAYFAVTATGSAGSAGLEVVDADGSSNLFSLGESTATGAYDYVSACVLDDDSVLMDGQTFQRLTLVRPTNGTIMAAYAAGKVNGRTMHAFGSGASARAYYVSADETGIYVLNPLTGTPVNIVPASSLPGAARGLEAKPDESTLYVSGDGGYIRKFNRAASGTAWTADAGFNAPAMTGEARGVALSPNGTILWVANNNTADSTKNRVFGVNAVTGTALSTAAYQYVFGTTFTPQGLAVSAGGNLFVQGWRGTATGITANAVVVLAPPEGATTDQTNSAAFNVPATVGPVTVSTGPAASGPTYHGATITWDTTVPSDSTVQYGTSPGAYTQTATADAAPNLVTHHAVTIDGLDANRDYYYRVLSAADGYTAVTSSPASFTTASLGLANVLVTDVTDTTARVQWTTLAPASSAVRFGTTPDGLNDVRTDDTLSLAHDVLLTGLAPGTTWYAAPESGPGFAPPAPVAGPELTIKTLKSARIAWERLDAGTDAATLTWQADQALAGTVRYGAAPDALSASVSVDATASGEAALTGLSAGTTYYYQMALTADGVAPLTTPVAAFTTETPGGAVKTVTQSNAADIATALRVNVDLGVDGHLLSLQKQAVPGTPVTTTPLPAPRYQHAVAAHNGYLYAIGGRDADGAATAGVSFAPILADGTVGAWASTSALPAPRIGIADMAFGYSGRLYVVGGADAQFTALNTVLYATQNADGTLGPWQTTTALPLPNGRDEGSAVVVDGRVVVSGGEDNLSSPTTDLNRYSAAIHADGSLGPWEVVSGAPISLRDNRARANAGAFYAYGGHDADAIYGNHAGISGIEPTGALTPSLADPQAMNANRYAFTAAITGGKLVTVAGREKPNTFTRAMEYATLKADGSLGPWTVSPELAPDAADAPDGKDYNGRIYSVGGRLSYGTGAFANATAAVAVVPMTPAPAKDGAAYAYAGSFESPILDLGEATNLRRLVVDATGDVAVRYRFAGGNGVFSDWLTPAGDAGDLTGGARYFQYALTLAGDGSGTPTVDSVTLSTGPASGVPLPGDVNMDGLVTRTDAALALQIAGGLLPATGPGLSLPNADVDGDGQVTLRDATAIVTVAH